jgi:hypothetical protein
MDHFGLRNLGELPNAEELRRAYLPGATAQVGAPKPPDDSHEATGKKNPASLESSQTERPS